MEKGLSPVPKTLYIDDPTEEEGYQKPEPVKLSPPRGESQDRVMMTPGIYDPLFGPATDNEFDYLLRIKPEIRPYAETVRECLNQFLEMRKRVMESLRVMENLPKP